MDAVPETTGKYYPVRDSCDKDGDPAEKCVYTQALFYQSYTKFNYKFMYHLSTVWIDSYTIDPSTYTTLTISRDNFEITSSEIRGKTIHKKPNS